MTLNQIIFSTLNITEFKDLPGVVGWEERNNPLILARLREEQEAARQREIQALMDFVSGIK